MIEIKSASELKQTDERKKALEYCIKYIMMYIERANEQGKRETCFTPTMGYVNGKYIDCEDELKQMFRAKGYGFKPTGIIGGVWQRTENIYW